jgi:hypothetical protein
MDIAPRLRAALAILVGASSTLAACPARAQAAAPPSVEAPPMLDDYAGHYVGVQIDLGAGVPLGGASTAARGVPSVLVNGELDVDIGRFFQLGARVMALLPGSELASGKKSSAVGSVTAQARVFPIGVQALGILRPYAGFGLGYTFITTKNECVDLGFGCSDRTLWSGLMIEPLLGLRLDIPRSGSLPAEPRRVTRVISIYLEAAYQKSFWFTQPAPAIDRLGFMAGAAITL